MVVCVLGCYRLSLSSADRAPESLGDGRRSLVQIQWEVCNGQFNQALTTRSQKDRVDNFTAG